MDPLGRCIAAYVVFLFLAALFSVGAAVLNTLRALDEDEKDDSVESRLWAHKNLYRFRMYAAASVCVMICGGAAWYALFDRFASLFGGKAALAALLFALAAALPTALCGIFLPTALAERMTTADGVYHFVGRLKNAALVFTFPAEFVFRAILRATKTELDAARSDVTEQEILQLVDEGESSGAIDSEKREMIENIFDFSEHSVREVMTHYMDVAAIPVGADDAEILKLISETGYSRYPVYEDDISKVTGMLIAKEYLCDRLSDKPRGFASLVRVPLFVPESMLTDEVLRRMKEREQHMAIVVNEYGEASGLVTMEDLLEEIVGTIYDETDTEEDREPDVRDMGDGTFRVDAKLPLDELEKALGQSVDAPEGVDTVGALFFSKLTTIPDDGEPIDVETDGLLLHSDGLSERRLDEVTLRRKETPEDQSAEE